MQLTWKVLCAGLAGIIAAVTTWLLVDASGILANAFSDRGVVSLGSHAVEYAVYQGIFAILLATLAAAADGISRDSPIQRRNELVIGLGCGLLGGLLGPALGAGLCVLFPAPIYTADGSSAAYLANIVFMSLGWAVTGCAAGSVAGLSRRSRRMTTIGGLSGFLGALGGGILFQFVASIGNQDAAMGLPWRLGALMATGMLSCVCATVFTEFHRPAWLRVLASRGHGREYTIVRSPFKIGSDPDCDIVLPAGPNIAPTHVIIELIADMGRHRLRHAARMIAGHQRYAPTIINDAGITSEKWLTDGDTINIAGVVFLFNETATHVPVLEAPQVRRPYIEDRIWERTVDKTRAISSVILPVTDVATEDNELLSGPPEGEAPSVSRRSQRQIRRDRVDEPGDEAPNPLPTSRMPPASNITQIDIPNPAGSPLPPVTAPLPSLPVLTPANPGNGRKMIGTRLACVGGPYLGQSFPLSHTSALLGRSLDHAIALPADTKVSRTHARIVYEGGVHVISDFGSSNGILVNDEFVTAPHRLRIGDVITAGESQLRYE